MPQEPAATESGWDDERVSVSRSFVRDMEGLWSEVLKMAAVVEDALCQSIHALCDGHVELASEVKSRKRMLDRWEVHIERECVRVLALHQPVASDLRRVAAVLKINGELERLGDLARHISKRIKKMADDPHAFPIPQSLESLGVQALAQIHDSLDSLTQSDVSRAQAVIAADRRIDREYHGVQKQLKQAIARNPERINTLLRLVNTARNLERIADHAAKIAESVVYLKEGRILRHGPMDLAAPADLAVPPPSPSTPATGTRS